MNHAITRIVGFVLALPLVAWEVGSGARKLGRRGWARFNRVIGRRP